MALRAFCADRRPLSWRPLNPTVPLAENCAGLSSYCFPADHLMPLSRTPTNTNCSLVIAGFIPTIAAPFTGDRIFTFEVLHSIQKVAVKRFRVLPFKWRIKRNVLDDEWRMLSSIPGAILEHTSKRSMYLSYISSCFKDILYFSKTVFVEPDETFTCNERDFTSFEFGRNTWMESARFVNYSNDALLCLNDAPHRHLASIGKITDIQPNI